MNVLGLIPARGGSKGVPRKNIKVLGGKPLIQYSIEAGLGARFVDQLVVSTEDPEIADVSRQLGAAVPFLRPATLAGDRSPTLGVIRHALQFFLDQGITYDCVCLLQPTAPLRTADDIDQAMEIFMDKQADSLISVIPVPHAYNPHWVFEAKESSGFLHIATGEKDIIPRRQELPPAYIRNGAIYLMKSRLVLEENSLYGQRIAYYEMPMERYVNIDTPEDWEEAERKIALSIA